MRMPIASLCLFALLGACAEGDLGNPSPTPNARPSALRAGQRPTAAALFHVPVGRSSVQGPADAKVTIIAFSEVQCPFCRRVLTTLERIRKVYRNEVRIVFKHRPLPFHSRALPSALALEAAAEQGRFWQLHDRLFAHQRALGDAQLDTHAEAAGLDVERFRSDLKSTEVKARVDADLALAKRLNVRGTPTFFINGRRLTGAQPFERFRVLIDQEMARATDLLKTGVPRTRLYATLIKDGQTQVQARRPALGRSAAEGARRQAPAQRVKIEAGDSPSRGPADAPINLVLFSDVECPFCKRIEPTLRAVEKAYPGKVRIIWKNKPLPFHKNAKLAAAALHAAGAQGKFWEMHAELMGTKERPTEKVIVAAARKLGLDVEALRNEMRSTRVQDIIASDLRLADSVGVRGTPTSIINGRRVVGAVPFAKLKSIIDEELQRLR